MNLNLQGGGAERQLVQLVRNWQQRDWRLEVLLLERQGVWLKELPSEVPCYALTTNKMPSGSFTKILWALRLVPRLQKFFKEHPCDVVLTFLWLPTVIAAIVFRRLTNPPLLVWSVQIDLDWDLTLHRDSRLRRRLVLTFLPNQVNHFIAVSEGIRFKTQKILGASPDRFTVIPNSIELARIREMSAMPDAVPPRETTVRLISIGRLHPQKGMDILLSVLAKINCKNRNWECYILGDGSERLKLMQLAETLKLKNQVSFAGFVSNPYAWLKMADVFVLPSRWEPFGIAILEAMALGLPVIATATDGAKDIIEDGSDGFLVPIGDVDALAEAILRLIRNPELRRQLGENAKRKAVRYDAPLIAKQYASLLERLVKEGVKGAQSPAGGALGLGVV